MTLPSSIAREAQKLATDRPVKLYEIDATDIGGLIFRFCSSIDVELQIASLTSAGVVATCETSTNHLLETGDGVRIWNALEPQYNGDFSVTVIDATHFTYTMASNPGVDASGGYLKGIRLNNVITFDGNEYSPIEIDVSGFEWDGGGSSLPTPKLLISNKHKILVAAVLNLKNLNNAKFTRIRTFRKHLDDGTDPDNMMFFPKEIYRINRKSAQNKIFMEFELAAAIDQEGVKIPGEQCLRDTCLQRYRHYDGAAFDYSKATCPYVGGTYYKSNGDLTFDPALDRCGKHLSDCILRFGNAPLPIKATPGIGGR